jgi:hypothetical protein
LKHKKKERPQEGRSFSILLGMTGFGPVCPWSEAEVFALFAVPTASETFYMSRLMIRKRFQFDRRIKAEFNYDKQLSELHRGEAQTLFVDNSFTRP